MFRRSQNIFAFPAGMVYQVKRKSWESDQGLMAIMHMKCHMFELRMKELINDWKQLQLFTQLE